MFVISLLHDGQLLKTAIRPDPNEAVKLAHKWYKEHYNDCHPDGSILIDKEVRGQQYNVRFAEISFSQSSEEVKLTLLQKDAPVFRTKYAEVTKVFLSHFLEYALTKLTDFVKEKNNKGS